MIQDPQLACLRAKVAQEKDGVLGSMENSLDNGARFVAHVEMGIATVVLSWST